MFVGTEWLVDAAECDSDSLCNVVTLRSLLKRVIAELDLKAIGDIVLHQFPSPGGITAFVLLTESHLTCHTYPEFGIATFNLYCCRTRPEWQWKDRLAEALGAGIVNIRKMEREIDSFDVRLQTTAAGQRSER